MRVNFYTTTGMNPHTGYGKMEIGLLRGLREAGIEVGLFGPVSKSIAAKPFAINGGERLAEISILTARPEACNEDWLLRRTRNWLYTMSESTKVSSRWVETINRLVERVIVPCPALVDIYHESGVTVPVHCIPLGVDLFVPKPQDLFAPSAERPRRSDTFTFLTYSLGDMRKGADLAILAFKTLFGGDNGYKLKIKARDGWERGWLRGCVDPQIEMIGGETDEAAWWKLLGEVDAFVFPSRGEGFGYPPREAALAGLPTVATEALGMWDVACWGYPIPVREMWPSQFDEDTAANARDGQWWEPDGDALQTAMRYIVDHYDEALEKAGQGRNYLLNNFGWRDTGEKFVELLDGAR